MRGLEAGAPPGTGVKEAPGSAGGEIGAQPGTGRGDPPPKPNFFGGTLVRPHLNRQPRAPEAEVRGGSGAGDEPEVALGTGSGSARGRLSRTPNMAAPRSRCILGRRRPNPFPGRDYWQDVLAADSWGWD